MKVVYTDTEGFKSVRDVPKSLSPSKYEMGVILGPPDLTLLNLDKKDILKLNNALVDAELLCYGDLNGNRGRLLKLIEKVLELSPLESKALRLEIIGIYQVDTLEE